MIEKVSLQGLRYLAGASDGLPQRTATVTLKATGDVQAWHRHIAAPQDLVRPLALLLPTQRHEPGHIERLLAQVQQPVPPEQAFAQAILGLCLSLQREAGDAAWLGRVVKVRQTPTGLEVRLALPCEREAVVKDALQWAARWWLQWGNPDASPESEAALLQSCQRWLEGAQAGGLSPNTLRFALAAHARGWPVSVAHQVLHIGWGEARNRLDSSFTGQTPQLAARLARDKHLTSRLLHEAGVPVPESVRVRNWDGARQAALQFGWPVVIKPANLDQGVGVVPGILDDETLRKAFDQAIRHSPGAVIVERHITGDDYRLLVVHGRLLMATRRVPGGVTGDGRQTIAELVEQCNADPRRGTGKRSLMIRLELDEEASGLLREQALSADSIPAAGQCVRLRRTANISTGGTAEDATPLIHPDNRLVAERAARILGLDIAGVDFLCPDISRSWREVGGGICEVNAQPGFRPHWLCNPDRNVNGEILDILFAQRPPRIPTAAITGTRGTTAVAQMLHHIWLQAGRRAGLACARGIRLGEEWIHPEPVPPVHAACRMLLPDTDLQSLVLEISDTELMRDGHPLDRYGVAALLNVQDDQPGVAGQDSLATTQQLRARTLRRATQAVVVNADDARCLEMSRQARLPRKVLVSASADNPAVLAHCQAGGQAVYTLSRDTVDWVCLATGERTQLLMPMDDIAPASSGSPALVAENARFAIALAWAQGIAPDPIRNAMRSAGTSI